MALSQRLPRIDASRFSMVPRPDIPRSTFVTTHSNKTTFDAGFLVPIHCDEVLPGDVHQGEVTIFARLSTPLFPIMDQMYLETFFFFVPNRLVWDNWVKMMGERSPDPDSSISYTVPQIVSPAGGWVNSSLQDYLGVPGAGQIQGAGTISINALPFRAYALIYNEWFRDQNLQDSIPISTGDGPDAALAYIMQHRNKTHDYFTSALPWPLKGGTDVQIPGFSGTGLAPVKGIGLAAGVAFTAGATAVYETADAGVGSSQIYPSNYQTATPSGFFVKGTSNATGGAGARPQIYADLSTVTGATINALRLAVQTQRLLERDARGGTRYTELLRSHFGVMPQDARLQRPEYIGGGQTVVQTSAIPQTSATTVDSPLGALGAAATVADNHRFSYSATEHGFIIGLAHVRAELTYQQGLHRMWTRQTRYDYYWPVFAHLGEQAIRNDEIYCRGTAAGSQDSATFGYQERWAEYRHRPSKITGLFRSTTTGNIDEWHLAQEFTSLPTLNESFIRDTPPMSRVLAAGSTADNMQILFDSVFKIKSTRPMPMYSVPGMMDRF